MQFLYKIPGYILLLFGGFCLSWGGFVIRSFEEASVWQILLLRSFFFMKKYQEIFETVILASFFIISVMAIAPIT